MVRVTATIPGAQPATLGLVRERARSLVTKGKARVLLLGAQPRWDGPATLSVEGRTVHVRPGVSPLAVLSEYADLPDGDFLVILTDRTEQDLGEAVMLRAHGRAVERPDDWNAVAEMTGALTIDPALRRLGRWPAVALLEHRPARGWPVAPAGVLTADHALTNLLAHLLGEPLPAQLDAIHLVELVSRVDTRAAWAAVDGELRGHLTRWAADVFGPQARMALTAAASTPVSVVAIGLAMDVLWPPRARDVAEAQISARTRIERYVGGAPVQADHAWALARDARDIALRMDDADDPELRNILTQAESLLRDLGWAEGLANSDILPSGRTARIEFLAAAIDAHLAGRGDRKAVEDALALVVGHKLADRDPREVEAARMATRLVRWLGCEHPTPASLGESLHLQADDGGWADRALATVWTGSAIPAVAAAYRRLAERAAGERATRDDLAAGQLAAAGADDDVPSGVVPVERLLADVVHPIQAKAPVLLVVLDGMSLRVATELTQNVLDLGWTELVPGETGRRAVALSVLPSVTAYSRTSLLTGGLRAGTQATEKSRFPALMHGPLFHKDDLRAPAGSLLPQAVEDAIANTANRVVGVVLNTIDDALDSDDPDGTRWDLNRVQHLRPLLNSAGRAGRVVVLTSDHGHVVERGGEYRPMAGSEARWRPVSGGTAGAGEVLVRGSRVLAPGGAAILAWDEKLRYGVKKAGYHGGASLQEITVPVIVLDYRGRPDLAGWRLASPQVPTWWNDPLVSRRQLSSVEAQLAAAITTGRRQKGGGSKAAPPAPEGFESLLPELTQAGPAVAAPLTALPAGAGGGGLVDRLLGSPVYAAQRARAGRRALGDDVVAAVLRVLLARGGRAHRETVAAAAGVPVGGLEPRLAALRRLLNVEGYTVVGEDADGVTIVLDEKLLAEQFELGR